MMNNWPHPRIRATVFFWSTVWVASLAQGDHVTGTTSNINIVSDNSKPNVIVEPFLASWCAKQFPEQLPNFDAYDMLRMMPHGKHSKFEPFLGKWCFEQFPNELIASDENVNGLNEDTAISDLYIHHEQVEPFLQAWGTQQQVRALTAATGADPISTTTKTDIEDIEPYMGKWCVAQYPQQLGHLAPTVYNDVLQKHVKFEPALARWCFEQFPQELGTLNTPAVLEGLVSNHALVESELLQWTFTTTATAPANSSHDKNKTAVICLSVALSVTVLALVYVLVNRHSRGWFISEKEEEFTDPDAPKQAANTDYGVEPAPPVADAVV